LRIGPRRFAPSSAMWIAADRICRSGANLVLLIWLARQLGPGSYGELAFSMSIVALVSAFANLGADGMLTRSFVAGSGAKFGVETALLGRIVGGIVAICLATVIAAFTGHGDPRLVLMTALLASQWLVRSSDVFELWFQAKAKAVYPAIARLCAFVIAASLQVAVVVNHAPLWVLCLAITTEYCLACAALAILWFRKSGAKLGRPSWSSTGDWLGGAKWTFIFALSIAAQGRVDQLMIGHYTGNHALGEYAAALRIVEGLMFAPGILVAAMAPAVYHARSRSKAEFEAAVVRLYKLMLFFSMSVSVVLVALPGQISTAVFGVAFTSAATFLPMLCPRLVLGCVGVVRTVVFTAEGRFRYLASAAVLGATLNTVGTWILVPRLGVTGAILASTCAYLLSGVVIDLAMHDTRFNNLLVWRGMRSLLPQPRSANPR